ncbi:hypothetical protein BDY21DRAFT_377808 [Lineolata rhizophorae]|uniref:J domain-containing protein n=1 Tax=Lineolata rhizophorae TaxID=578093 RepID=A0A6A6P6C0_9PEZI|nr:hypothetical protein BDY21DRAFT_377808 [Lineolata rhizophorae]
MILKKAVPLLPSCSALQGPVPLPQCGSCHHHRTQYYHHRPTAPDPISTRSPNNAPSGSRTYATISSSNPEDLPPWPTTVPPHKVPTPYQILGLKKGSPYNKRCFYELVKLYHPDRHVCSSSDHPVAPAKPPAAPAAAAHIPHAVRLERYRLLVAAHDILSDPAKRAAYDRWGAGWNGLPGVKDHNGRAPRSQHEGPQHHGAWGGAWGGYAGAGGPRYQHAYQHAGPDPMNNATWEDWERYSRGSGGAGGADGPNPDARQVPVIPNHAAAVLLFTMSVLGGAYQATRAERRGRTFLERRERLHLQSSGELRRVRSETLTDGDASKREIFRQRANARAKAAAEEERRAERGGDWMDS